VTKIKDGLAVVAEKGHAANKAVLDGVGGVLPVHGGRLVARAAHRAAGRGAAAGATTAALGGAAGARALAGTAAGHVEK